MQKIIETFSEQFRFEPVVENITGLSDTKKFLVAGMGGSHLSAGILKALYPHVDLGIHRNYGLPRDYSDLDERILIASSYSGNTAETLDAYTAARSRGISTAVIASGGRLLEAAKSDEIPYLAIPATDIPPRMATGYALLGLLALLGMKSELSDVKKRGMSLDAGSLEPTAKNISEVLHNKIPLIYASEENSSLAYSWKISFNETGKIPAFYNVFPELNHNEMTGFDIRPSTTSLSQNIRVIFLHDENDAQEIQKRMELTMELYRARGIAYTEIKVTGASRFERVWLGILLGHWTALFLSHHYETEPERVPMIEEFKEKLQSRI